MIKIVHRVDKIISFFGGINKIFEETNKTLKETIKSNELVSNKLDIMFKGIHSFLNKFKR